MSNLLFTGAAFDLKQEIGNIFFGDITATGAPVGGPGFAVRWPAVPGSDPLSSVSIDFDLKWGTKFLRLDLFEEGWQESSWTWPPEGSPGYAATPSVTNFGFPPGSSNIPRSESVFLRRFGISWGGALEAGSIQPGRNYQ